MKIKKKITLLPLFLLMAFTSMETFAQKNLESWIKECEKDASIDLTVIDNKFPDTRKPDSYIVKIILKDKSQLLDKMYEAYSKDKDNAYSASDKRVNRAMVPDRCAFKVTEKDKTVTDIVFDFYYHKGEVRNETVVTMIKRFDSANKELDKKRNRHYLGG